MTLLLFSLFFHPTLAFYFCFFRSELLSTFRSLRSARLHLPLPLHCYFHLKFPQGYNKMRQKISRASSGKKPSSIAAMQIKEARDCRGFLVLFFQPPLKCSTDCCSGVTQAPRTRSSCCLNAVRKLHWHAPAEI